MQESLYSWLQTLSEEQIYPLVRDLLVEMGYQRVSITHGPLEYGRDLVFLEIDHLGREIWRGIQVKVGHLSGNLTSEGARSVVTQCEAAIETPFYLPSGEQITFSEIWLIYARPLGEQAKASIVGKLKPRFPIYIIDAPYLCDLLTKFLPGLLAAKSKPIDDYLERLLTFADSTEEYFKIRLTSKFSLLDVYVEPRISIRLLPKDWIDGLSSLNSVIGADYLCENINYLLCMSRRRLLPAVVHFKIAETITRARSIIRALSTMQWYPEKEVDRSSVLLEISGMLEIPPFSESELLPETYRYASNINHNTLRTVESSLRSLRDAARQKFVMEDRVKNRADAMVDISGKGLTLKGSIEVAKYRGLRVLIEYDDLLRSKRPILHQEEYEARSNRIRQGREQFFSGLESAYRSSINDADEMVQIAVEAGQILFSDMEVAGEFKSLEKDVSRAAFLSEQLRLCFSSFHAVLVEQLRQLWLDLDQGESVLSASAALNALPSLVELEQLSRFVAEFYGVPREELIELQAEASAVCGSVPRVIVLGDLGFGKTTLLKQVSRKYIENLEASDSKSVPVFCRLATLHPEQGERITDSFRNYSEADLPRAEELGGENIFWLLDGFDELQGGKLKTDLIDWLTGEGLKEQFIVSSRPFAFPRYLPGALSVSLVQFSADDIQKFVDSFPWQDEDGSVKFLDMLKKAPELMKLASTPLLLTLIIILAQAQRTGELPKTREGLYELLLNLFLREWDLAKGLRRTQTIDDEFLRLKILRRAAFSLYAARKRTFSRGEFIETLMRVRGPYPLEVDAAVRFLADLIRDCLVVPLSREALGFFHFSIHEYLAATELCDDTAPNRVFDAVKGFFMYGGWWEEVLVFYASIKRDIADVLENLHNISIPAKQGGSLNPEFVRLIERLLDAADFTDLSRLSPKGVVALALAELDAGGGRDRWNTFARLNSRNVSLSLLRSDS